MRDPLILHEGNNPRPHEGARSNVFLQLNPSSGATPLLASRMALPLPLVSNGTTAGGLASPYGHAFTRFVTFTLPNPDVKSQPVCAG